MPLSVLLEVAYACPHSRTKIRSAEMKLFKNLAAGTKISGALAIATLTLFGSAFGQAESRKNNPYSPSPSIKSKIAEQRSTDKGGSNVSFVMQRSSAPIKDETTPIVPNRPSIAQATYKIAKEAEIRALPPTEIYRIGVGDVLFIDLKNSAQGSGYFTVRNDGTIDYPLAGENVVVADQTPEAAEEIISGGITLFSSPQIEVKVRQYGSHKIVISGLAENLGEKNLKREAMPLFAIKAEAIVSSKATRVQISRTADSKPESYDLRDPKTDDVLVFPGNRVEFTAESATARSGETYIIGGEVVSGGQKELSYGLTLYQAIVLSGGTKGDPKKAIIRRKNDKGLFTVFEHNLRSIKEGKAMDPFLTVGDIIEIRN